MAVQMLGIKTKFTDDQGRPLVGGSVHTYYAGTSLPQDTFSDPELTVPNTNPVKLDDTGSANIFLKGTYRVRVFDRKGKFVEEQDNVDQLATVAEVFKNKGGLNAANERIDALTSEVNSVKEKTLVVESVADLSTIKNPKDGLRVYVKSYHAGLNKGGGYFTYDSSKTNINDKGLIINGWVREDLNVISVKEFGAVGDSTIDDNKAIQDNIDWTEVNKVPYVFIPTTTENYVLQSPVEITEPGIRIFGNKAASYDRGVGRNGFVLVGEQAGYAFNLGNYRKADGTDSSTNRADAFSLSNIGFKPVDYSLRRQKDGVHFTSSTNGPDRGGVISECSFINLKNGVYLPYTNQETQYATLNIEKSVFVGCDYGVVAEGNVLGFRFVGNQCEQNAKGGIKGTFNGGVTITDNMLEGQPNAIEIYSPPVTGGSPKVEIARNYFELQRGEFVISYTATATNNRLIVRDNYNSHFQKWWDGSKWVLENTDWIRLRGKGASVHVENYDPHPVTYEGGAVTEMDSKAMGNANINYFRVRGPEASGALGVHVIRPSQELTIKRGEYYEYLPANGLLNRVTKTHTAYGYTTVLDFKNGIYTPLNVAVAKNDVVAVNMLIQTDKVRKQDFIVQFMNSDYTATVHDRVIDIPRLTQGEWALVTIVFRALVDSNTLNMRVACPSDDNLKRHCLGVVVANYGQLLDNASNIKPDENTYLDTKDIYPTMPTVQTRFIREFDQTALNIPTGGYVEKEYIADISVNVGDHVTLSTDKSLNGVVTNVWVDRSRAIKVRFYNATSDTIRLDAFKVSLLINK